MKTLITFYSRTGFTKKVAETIAKKLKADSQELIDTKNRSGVWGWIIAGKDAAMKNQAKIKPLKKDPSKYDLVVIGTPVWAGDMTPAVRTFIMKSRKNFKKVALFCTQGGAQGQKCLNEIRALISKKPLATMMITTKEVSHDNYADKLNVFIKKIKNK